MLLLRFFFFFLFAQIHTHTQQQQKFCSVSFFLVVTLFFFRPTAQTDTRPSRPLHRPFRTALGDEAAQFNFHFKLDSIEWIGAITAVALIHCTHFHHRHHSSSADYQQTIASSFIASLSNLNAAAAAAAASIVTRTHKHKKGFFASFAFVSRAEIKNKLNQFEIDRKRRRRSRRRIIIRLVKRWKSTAATRRCKKKKRIGGGGGEDGRRRSSSRYPPPPPKPPSKPVYKTNYKTNNEPTKRQQQQVVRHRYIRTALHCRQQRGEGECLNWSSVELISSKINN